MATGVEFVSCQPNQPCMDFRSWQFVSQIHEGKCTSTWLMLLFWVRALIAELLPASCEKPSLANLLLLGTQEALIVNFFEKQTV